MTVSVYKQSICNAGISSNFLTCISSFEQEKELLMKKRKQIEEAERAQRSKVVISFDLVGRKVIIL